MAVLTLIDRPKSTLAHKLARSKFLRLVIVIALLCALAAFVSGGMSSQVTENQTKFLSDAVRRSAVQCFALEGRFPDSIKYLEDNYGLLIDHDRYYVYYEYVGSNLIPQVRVHQKVDQIER
jgi:hypothetical protein